MGQLITTVVGGALGFMIGGPMGASIGMQLGGMIGATLFGPTVKGPRLNDLKVTASTYGTAIPEVYGTVRIGGNLIWTSGIKETKHSSRAGKGGSKQENYTYDATFAMALCKGTIDDILRIWADGKLIFDSSGNATRDLGTTPSSSFVAAITKSKKKDNIKFRVYRGDEEQLPDSLIVADKGSGNVSGHRGMAYVVFEKFQLGDYGNRIPQLTFEVTKQINSNFPTVVVTESGGDVPPGITGKEWIPDWDLGRLVAFDNSTTLVCDLTTMGVITEGAPIGSGGKYLQGTGLYFRETNTSNSRRWRVWNMLTLSDEGYVGKAGGSLNGVYINSSGTILEQYAALRTLGHVVLPVGSGGRMLLLMIGWTGAAWCLEYGNSIPIFYKSADFQGKIIAGREDPSSAQFISYRRNSGQFQMQVWTVGANANGSHYTDGDGDLAWRMSDDWAVERINLTPFPGKDYDPTVVLYDHSDNTIFSAGKVDNALATFKYSIENGTYKFAVKHPTLPPPTQAAQYSRINGGTFGYGYVAYTQTSKLVQVDLQNGGVVQNYAFGSTYGSTLYFGQHQHWDDVSSSLIVETYQNFRRIAFRNGASHMDVSDIVSDICLRTGVLTEIDIDVSGLSTGNLVGYTIDRETTARDVLKQLGTAFLFDGYESDYKLKFESRGNAASVTIPENWIGRDRDGVVVKETLTQELEMPMRVTVNFYDTSRDHQQGSQTAKRRAGPVPTMWTRKEDIIDLPITWTPDDAKQCADKLLKMSWANRTTFQMSLPWRYLKYDPTDVATVALLDGTTYSMRFNEVNIGADFVVEVSAVSEKDTAYSSTASGNWSITDGQSISGIFPCYPMVINTPLLRDVDYNTTGNSLCYMSVGTNALSFNGASLQMSDGIDYRGIGYIDSDTVTGYCLTALPKITYYEGTDEDSILYVRLANPSHTLSSVTQDEMLAGANAALVGEEIIGFRDATLETNGTWKLTGLLRARRGTNYAVGSHSVNERFLLLEEAAVLAFARSADNYNVERDFKAVPAGTMTTDALTYHATLVPRDLMPYTPETITISDDGTTVTMTAQRRSRVTSPLRDGSGFIPYKEGEKIDAKIKYEIWPDLTIDDTATATTTTPAITGSAALFDGGGDDILPSFTFPLASLSGATKFLIKLYETGYVDGIPKWIQFDRLDADRWNFIELY